MIEDVLNEAQLKFIIKRINSFSEGYRQNLAFLNRDRDRLSALFRSYMLKEKKEGLVHIYLNVRYCSEREVFRNIAYSLLSEYLHSSESLDDLLRKAELIIPHSVSFIKENLNYRYKLNFSQVLELINKFVEEAQRRCILIIEEFQELKKIFNHFTKDFATFLMFQRKCMVIISSSDVHTAEVILSSELNLLFGNFEKIYLNSSNLLANYLYLKQTLSQFNPSSFFLSFFINLLGDNTHYYDILGRYINVYYTDNEFRTIERVLKNLLLDPQSYFHCRFLSHIDMLKEKTKDYASLIKILISVSEGYTRKRELYSLNIAPIKKLSSKLQRLVELGYLIDFGDIYSLEDGLFSLWLSHIFKFNFSPNILDLRKKEDLFLQNLNITIHTYREDFCKDSIEKIIELINSFKDDTLKIDERRVRLPWIKRIKLLTNEGGRLNFIVGEGREIVLVGVKKEEVEDSDIISYLGKADLLNTKRLRKLFISLDDFSTGAKFIAKENKLIIWNGNDLNRILRLYGKTYVVPEEKKGPFNRREKSDIENDMNYADK